MKAIYSCTGALLAILAGAGVAIFRPHVMTAGPGSVATVNSTVAPAAPAAQKMRLAENYGKLPLGFEANQGQTDSRVKFLSRGRGYSLFLTGDEAVLTLGSTSQKAKGKSQKAKVQAGEAPTGAGSDPARSANGGDVAPTLRSAHAGLMPGLATANDLPPSDHGLRTTDSVLRMKLVGANANAAVTGAEELPGTSNYFIGNDPKKWRTNVPTYAKVRYQNVYPGVDLVYYGNQGGQLEYDFVVAPGADPAAIRLALSGTLEAGSRQSAVGSANTERSAQAVAAGLPRHPNVGAVREPPTVAAGLSRHASSENGGVKPPLQERARRNAPLKIAASGDLVVQTDGGEIRFHKPLVYQPSNNNGPRTSDLGLRTPVEGNFVLEANNQVGFQVASYDHTRPLVIDPVLSYSTYLGGSNYDDGTAISVDASGHAYVTGSTASTDFPTADPIQILNRGKYDVFVSEFTPDGSALVYSTYLGGTGSENGLSIAVDSSGNAYVTGWTASDDFPTVNPVQANSNGITVFVAKLNAAGSALVYSTYLGGGSADQGAGIAVDASGSAYVTGQTNSTEFPTVNALQGSNHGGYDAFVAKLNPDGSSLAYSTYLGGGGNDWGEGIAVDSSGNAYVTGATYSTDFPTANPLQGTNHGLSDAFVAKLNPAGTALVYSTYLGGSSYDNGLGIAIDSSGSAYVTGFILSTDFPTVNALQESNHGNWDAFVAKLTSDGRALVYSTYLGGNDLDWGYGIAVDSSGNAYVIGRTFSSDFPTVNPLQANFLGLGDAFVAELTSDGSALVYSTYLGGTSQNFGQGIAVDSSGNAYVAGYTDSTDFPTANAFQPAIHTTVGFNAFISKISPSSGPEAALSGTSLTFGSELVGETSTSQSVTLTSSGTAALAIASIYASGDFALESTGTSCPYSGGSLAPVTNCTIVVSFTPTVSGIRTGMVTITDNNNAVANSTQTIALSGTGGLPPLIITASSASMTYGGGVPTITAGYVGFVNGDTAGSLTTPPTCSTTATSSSPVGSYPSTCSGAVDGNYTISYNAGTVTVGQASLTITAPSTTINAGSSIPSFTPTYTGFVNGQTAGSLTSQPTCMTTATNSSPAGNYPITCSGAVGSNYNISYVAGTLTLTGTGLQSKMNLSPSILSFGDQVLNTTSVRPVTVTNTGTAPLNVSGLTASSGYAAGGTCTSPVNPGFACEVNISFTPTALGTKTGTVTITSNASNSPQVVSLSGNGFSGAALSCTSCGIGSFVSGSGSGKATITLANAQNVALTGITVNITGSIDYSQTNTCGTTLGARQTCTITVTFAPSKVGTDNATLSVSDSATNSPQTATLLGAGLASPAISQAERPASGK